MKLRSYNEELLIAAALMGDLFNDVVIERRRHGLERDYSQPVKIEDILQKNIEIPCIYGDRSAILKSLENHEGAIKLPIFILQNKDLKVDDKRIADLHYDIFYQPDMQFQKLDPSNPHYKPYDLRKRRPVPVTIDYELSMIAKYKEDLDQMITNWIVHFRPDVYVKWYHPKFRKQKITIDSQIIGGQSVSYKKPDDNPGTRFQYEGTTSFTFKTWLFTGLDYDVPDDSNIGIIKHINWFPNTMDEINENGELINYPVFGSINPGPGGLYAVPSNMEFYNDGSDEAGIAERKYYINNITGHPKEQYTSGPVITPENIDADYLLDSNLEIKTAPKWNTYQDYCTCDLVSNERFGIKLIYFENGYPMSAWLQNNGSPSGDFLFQYFASSGNEKLTEIIGFNGEYADENFGICITESLPVNFEYNVETKDFIISGQCDNNRYNCLMYTKMNSVTGIEQSLQINNKPVYNNEIKIHLTRKFDTDYKKIHGYYDYTQNINILNSISTEKAGWKNNQNPIQFLLETPEHKKALTDLKTYLNTYWNDLEIYPCDRHGNKIEEEQSSFYKLDCSKKRFWSALDKLKLDTHNIDLLLVRQEFTYNNIEYTVMANKQLYFILTDEGIFDWGLIDIPKFAYLNHPIFQSTIKNGELIYGIGMMGNIASTY